MLLVIKRKLIPLLFLIRRNKTSNTSMKRKVETASSWRASLSKLKYWVVVLPFMTNDCWSVNKMFIQVILFQDGNKTMIKTVKSFFNIHSYKKICDIWLTADFNCVWNLPDTFSNKILLTEAICRQESNVGKTDLICLEHF